MLTVESTLTLLRKYDFNSTTSHPYIYSSGDNIGIRYLYYDDDYGTLERVKFFDNEEVLEEFLKKYRWYLNNGRANNVRMVLDNYQIMNPKVLFLRNNKIMVKGEMFDLDSFIMREKQIDALDPINRSIFEAGNLILIYDDIKNRQTEYFDSVKVLNNQVRQKYFDLQKEVDIYNGKKIEREIVLQKQSIMNDGINVLMETSAKDRYNQYKVTPPSLQEAQLFVKEIWDLLMNLELNPRFYEAQAIENNLRNEIRLVDKKLALMKQLNEDDDKFHKINLINKFRAINLECAKTSVVLDPNYVSKRVESIRRKYSYFDMLDFNSLDDYLKESLLNNNYDAVALKYAKGKVGIINNKPINEVASDLFVQYRDKLSPEEQAIMVLYNSKYRALIDMLLAVPDFSTKTPQEIVDVISKNKSYSKIKSECFDQIKRGFMNPQNADIQNKVFMGINFDTYETFIASMIDRVKILKNINNKMTLTGDVKLFFLVKDINDLANRRFFVVTNDLNSLQREITSKVDFIGVATMFKDLPILYAPYYVDFGDVYNKSVQPVFTIKENSKFELLIDGDDVRINVDDTFTYVSQFASNPELVEDISIVSEFNMVNELNFCKLALSSALVPSEPVQVQNTSIPVNQESNQYAAVESVDSENRNTVTIKKSQNPYDEGDFPKAKEDNINNGGNENV